MTKSNDYKVKLRRKSEPNYNLSISKDIYKIPVSHRSNMPLKYLISKNFMGNKLSSLFVDLAKDTGLIK